MKLKLATLALVAITLSAQTVLTVSSSAPTVKPGGTVTLSLTLSGPGAAGTQWTLALPTGVTATAAIGAAGTAASKTLACTTDWTLCLVYGLNTNLIGPGVVATYTVQYPSTAPAGTATYALSGLVAADAQGNSLPFAAGTSITVAVLSRYDLNGDGAVNAADVALALPQMLGTQPCSTADFNGDGKCNVIDLELLCLAAIGVIPL